MSKKEFHKSESRPHWPSYARALKREAKKIDKPGGEGFRILIERAASIEDPYYIALALAWIGRRMSELGLKSARVFSKSLESAKDVLQGWRRSEVLLLISKEMVKADLDDFKGLISAIKSIDDTLLKNKTLMDLKKIMARRGASWPSETIKASHKVFSPSTSLKKNGSKNAQFPIGKLQKHISIGLYNTYAGKTLTKNHIRVVARAAPLCIVYGFRLVLFNFPIDDVNEFVARVAGQTRIGDSGKYIQLLFERGWVIITNFNSESVDRWIIVSTTSNPDPAKKAPLEDVLNLKGSLCFLMGLGSSGLSNKVRKSSKYHVELTGGGVSLETCTAMGVLASKLDCLLSFQKHRL
jgi:hypothetical protein